MKLLVTSDDTGSVKEVVCSRGTDTSKQDATQPKAIRNVCAEPGASISNRILQMINFKSTFLVTSRLGGQVAVYDINHEDYELIHTYQLPTSDDDKPVSLIEYEEYDVVLVAYESGCIYIINFNNGNFDLKPIEIKLPGNKRISAFIHNPHADGIFACGGKENDARVVRLFKGEITTKVFETENKEDFFKPEVIFTARNVKNDHLDLRPPIWISKILFFKEGPKDGFKFLTATRYGQVRIYDTTHGKRPIHDYKVCEKPIVTLHFADSREEEIIISDTHNLVAKYSLTKIDSKAFKTHSASAGEITKPVSKLLGKFSAGGNTGAIFGVNIYDNEIISTGGLDRYLRVYDLESRDILAKVYLGVQISDVLMLDSEDEEEEVEAEQTEKQSKLEKRKRRIAMEENESDEEELWNQLEDNNKTKIEKKKRKV